MTAPNAEAIREALERRAAIYELLRRGAIRHVRAGKRILVSRKSVLDWLSGGHGPGAK